MTDTMFKKLFTPFKIGNCEIPNRIAVPAMVTNMPTEDGYATEQFIKYYEEKAKGGYGLIITEDYLINPNGKGYKHVAALYEDAQIEGHAKMVEAVHSHGSKIFCQIYHCGRQSNHFVNGGVQTVAPSPSADPWNRDMARELTVDEIHTFVRQFGEAAGRAKKCGFDGIEIHAGHGYLIAAFLSFHQNHRTDEYGGPLINRVRFLHEIYDEMRKNVGDDFPIMIRFSAVEGTANGRDLGEARVLAKMFEEWGVDAINCSNGLYSSYNDGIIATGGVGRVPEEIPGIAGDARVIMAEDVLRGRVNPEGNIYILGGGSVGIETACYLADAERGHISIVIRRNVVADKEDQGKVNFMRAFCDQRHVNFLFLHTVDELAEDGLVLTHKGVIETHPVDWVVLSCGYVPVNGLVGELADLGDKVVVVGDAIKCRDAEDAGNEGFDAGYNA